MTSNKKKKSPDESMLSGDEREIRVIDNYKI